jgi:hypothetical protein
MQIHVKEKTLGFKDFANIKVLDELDEGAFGEKTEVLNFCLREAHLLVDVL